jgi:hypothetical protein
VIAFGLVRVAHPEVGHGLLELAGTA